MATSTTAPTELANAEHELRMVHGRGYNSKHEAYSLPADAEEHARLDRQSYMIKLFMGSLYSQPDLVQSALRPGQSKRPTVLDIGTGSGVWAIEMAQEFPHADIVGMDLARPNVLDQPATIPSNCVLEIADANVDMDRYANKFDLVHLRCAQAGIHDFNLLLYNAARALRPGGLLLLINTVCVGFHEDKKTRFQPVQEGEPGFTWFAWMWSTIWDALGKKDIWTVNSLFFWEKWLKENPNYEDVQVETKFMPVGPWDEDAPINEKQASEMMLTNMIVTYKAFRPVFLEYFDKDEVKTDRILECAIHEMENVDYKSCLRWQFMSAKRKDSDWVPRPESAVPENLRFNPYEDWPPGRPN